MPVALLLVALALVALAPPAIAQPGPVTGRFENRTSTTRGYYVNARAGEATIRVNVVGDVAQPGVYELGAGFDLEDLLALAGTPTVAPLANLGEPEVRVRLYRPVGDGREVLYDADVADLLAEDADTPGLHEGDLVEVEIAGTARLYVWGAVRTPGVFEVGPTVDHRGALALAGGPVLPPVDVSVTRSVSVKVYRESAAGTGLLLDTTLEAFTSGDLALPAPEDGDTILVEVRERRGLTFRDFATAVAAVSGLATAVILGIDRLGSN